MPENDEKAPENQEKPEKRTTLQVQQEYFNAAMRAGDLAYRIAIEKEQLEELYENMRALNQEGARIQAEEVLARSKNNETPTPTAEAPKSVQ